MAQDCQVEAQGVQVDHLNPLTSFSLLITHRVVLQALDLAVGQRGALVPAALPPGAVLELHQHPAHRSTSIVERVRGER